MGTSNSTRRSMSKKQGVACCCGGNSAKHEDVEDVAPPSYRKPELQDFECVICKDLVFKPVVNACGHGFFCFWCAHESMGAGFQSSTCPMCRCVFSHMPRVCELAHAYLTKTWPVEYGARAAEVEAEEKQRNMFSPEPIGLPQHAGRTAQQLAGARLNSEQLPETPTGSGLQLAVESKGEVLEGGGGLADRQLAASAGTASQQGRVEELTVQDCECLLCHKLLFQPVVLSCGHAYCFLCLEERFPGTPVSCAYCQKAHLEDEVAVCGQLQEVIQGTFPQETHRRILQERARMGKRKGLLKRVSTSDEQTTAPKGFVHFGIECDACGVYPIVGERYQCQDCVEEIGFDLCGRCHAGREQPMLGSYLFKQKHLPQHTMHRVEPIPTFLHQVMETHPELSVSTVINMVMSMAEDMADDSSAQVSTPPEDEIINLAETNLFNDPPAPAAQGGVLSQENPTPAADGGGIGVGEPLNLDVNGDDGAAESGPLDLGSRTLAPSGGLAPAEFPLPAWWPTGSANRTIGSREASQSLTAERAVEDSDHARMGLDRGRMDSDLGRMDSDRGRMDSDRGRMDPHYGRIRTTPRGLGALEGGPIGATSSQSGAVDRSRQQAGMGGEMAQFDATRVPTLGRDLLSRINGEIGMEGARREGASYVGRSEEPGAVDRLQQSGAMEGGFSVAADRGENSSRGVVSDREPRQRCGGGGSGSHLAEEASRTGSEGERCSQAGGGPRVDGARGRASMEDGSATQEHQQRASCEPSLRRTDSYHQLMMATA